MYSNIINRTININHQVHNDRRSDKSIYVELYLYMEDVLQLSVTRVLSEEVLSCTQANLFYPAEISALQKTKL